MKRILLALIALAAIAMLVVSPYSITNTLDTYNKAKEDLNAFRPIRNSVAESQHELFVARDEFTRSRSSEIYFGDTDRLVSVLNNVATISVVSCEPYNAENHFSRLQGNETRTAAKLTLSVENTQTALAVINRLQLPIYSILVYEPNTIELIFMTGEDI